jgi:hypothetical protein
MTQQDKLTCVHEPFGDAFYYGPERMSQRFEGDEQARLDSGFSKSTYQTILDRFERESQKVRLHFFPFSFDCPTLSSLSDRLARMPLWCGSLGRSLRHHPVIWPVVCISIP